VCVVELLTSLMASEYSDHDSRPVVHLLGTPRLTVGARSVEIPESSTRLLAFVALRPIGVQRRAAAGTLWPVANDVRAAGNLRTALWRLNAALSALISADKTALHLSPDAAVDLHIMSAWALRLVTGRPRGTDVTVLPRDIETFDLLPGFYEDWALVERERFRHRMLHAVEALSRRQRDDGRWAQAVDTAMTVVAADPLRESAQRVLIEAHLAEGNVMEARRSYCLYRDLLHRELGVDPAPDLAALLSTRSPDQRRPARWVTAAR
jgi:DNA-binding SARP family transcriptional activator